METRDSGIYQRALEQYAKSMPPQCKPKGLQASPDKRRLSLRNLISAFVVLLAGYVCSALAFICEVISVRRRERYYPEPFVCSQDHQNDDIETIEATDL